MEWDIILLIAFAVLMLICCGGMMRMAFRGNRNHPDKE